MQTSRNFAKSRPGRPSVRQMRRAAGISEPRNAILVLKADHREVENLFKTFKRTESAVEKQGIAKKICDALKVHTRIDEEVLYPAFIAATGNNELHNEALVEHLTARNLIAEIENSVAGDPLFDAKVRALSEMIKQELTRKPGKRRVQAPAARSGFMGAAALARSPTAKERSGKRVPMT